MPKYHVKIEIPEIHFQGTGEVLGDHLMDVLKIHSPLLINDYTTEVEEKKDNEIGQV